MLAFFGIGPLELVALVALVIIFAAFILPKRRS
jgi:hypothetical protein